MKKITLSLALASTLAFGANETFKFSGVHYLGFKHDSATNTNKFETRRNYFELRAYPFENKKDYSRITFDTYQAANGSWNVRLKYGYLYLDNILPYTGVEVGLVHRPWIDFEEHHNWLFRSISKTFIEGTPDLVNSADLGVNFKTKTQYFSSEVGLFNGSGYHGIKLGKGMSFEWRATAHLLGTGNKKEKSSTTYADVSFFGQYGFDNVRNSNPANGKYVWYGINAVYNQPLFLVGATYLKTKDASASKAGSGWSVNAEIRPLKKVSLFGRYDDYKYDNGNRKKAIIAGAAYAYNSNVKFILDYHQVKVNGAKTRDSIGLSTEVKW